MLIRPTVPSDFSAIKPDPAIDGVAAFTLAEVAAWTGRAFTAMLNGVAVGMGGMIVTDRVGYAWVVVTDALRARPMLLHRFTARLVRAILAAGAVDRLEVVTRDTRAARWAKRVGFRFDASRASWVM